MLFHNKVFSFRWGDHFWTKPITNILTTSLESLYCQKISNESESDTIFTIYIVVCGSHG